MSLVRSTLSISLAFCLIFESISDRALVQLCTRAHTHSFNSPFSRTTQVSRYQNGKTNLDFTGARDSEWQWHHLGYMQVCTSLQTDNHASTPPQLCSIVYLIAPYAGYSHWYGWCFQLSLSVCLCL